ncbi:MAG: hypothetical protein ACJ764_00625 [Solirubrobacteraceae bacterium]
MNSGDYQTAFGLLSSSYQAENPSWSSDRTTADPGITIVSIGAPQFESGVARVPVEFFARDRNPSPDSDTQCREFTGTAALISEAGNWRYDPGTSSLSPTVISSTDSRCPQ